MEEFFIEGSRGTIAGRCLRAAAGPRRGDMLFVHGAWSSTWYWEKYFMPAFARAGYDCFALDLRGHGHSEGNIKLGTIGGYVDDVTRFVRRLGAPILIGHSMGGLIAQHVAARQALSGLVLMASVPHYGCWSGFFASLKASPLGVMKCLARLDLSPLVDDADAFRHLLLSRGPVETQYDYVLDQCGAESLLALMGMLLKLPPGLPDAAMPRLVIGAREDRFISVGDVERTARRLGTAPVIFPQTSHMLMIDERWPSVARSMLDWLDEQSGALPANQPAVGQPSVSQPGALAG
ncbi:alpha/beta hydrolase [Rhizobium sp. SG2393]|uniref:alpha/beta hydrolase n=1 Tax=Rhizobium sp. SG2393 TaxID=3276279 RepID=UPI003672C89A